MFGYFRECHREQLSIEHSMQDLDSAVGRLDNILMSVYVIISILIIAVALVGRSNVGSERILTHLCVCYTGSAISVGNYWSRYFDTWYVAPAQILTMYLTVRYRSKLAYRWQFARGVNEHHFLVRYYDGGRYYNN